MSTASDSHTVREELSWMRKVARRLIGSRLRKPFDSQDLVQATIAGVLGDLREKEFRDSAHRRGFLRKAMRNRALAMGRKEGRARQSGVDLDRQVGKEDSPSVAFGRAEDKQRVDELLARLPKADVEVLRLVHVERCSFEQVAGNLGINIEAARQRHCRAINKLRGMTGA